MSGESESFGERIARLCTERDVSQYKVSKAIGTQVANIDRSKTVSLRAAHAIASALGMTLWEIDAPILLPTTTRDAIDAGLIQEPS